MRNREGIMKKAGLILILAGLLISCPGPMSNSSVEKMGRVVISFGSTGSRTIVADLENAILSYDVVLTSLDGYSTKTGNVPFGSAGGTDYTLSGVEPGDWTLTVNANGSGGIVGVSEPIPITALIPGETRNVAAPITLLASGFGILDFSVTFPTLVTNSAGVLRSIDYVLGEIMEYTGGTPALIATLIPTISSASGISTAVFSRTGLTAAADLTLILTFRSGGASGTVAGVYSESVNIWPNQTSSMWIDATGSLVDGRVFVAGNFFDTNSGLADLVLSSTSDGMTPLMDYAFSSGTLSYTVKTPDSTIYFKPTRSISGQLIEYSWNGGTYAPLNSGSTSPGLTISANPATTLTIQITAPDRQTKSTYTIEVVPATFTITSHSGLWNTVFAAPFATKALVVTEGAFYALTQGQIKMTVDGVWVSNGLPVPPSGTVSFTNVQGTWYAATPGELYILNGSLWQNLAANPSVAWSLANLSGSPVLLCGDGNIRSWNGVWSIVSTAPVGTTSIGSDQAGTQLYALSGTTLRLWNAGVWTDTGISALPQSSIGITSNASIIYALVAH